MAPFSRILSKVMSEKAFSVNSVIFVLSRKNSVKCFLSSSKASLNFWKTLFRFNRPEPPQLMIPFSIFSHLQGFKLVSFGHFSQSANSMFRISRTIFSLKSRKLQMNIIRR
jgi:hypothetical protein